MSIQSVNIKTLTVQISCRLFLNEPLPLRWFCLNSKKKNVQNVDSTAEIPIAPASKLNQQKLWGYVAHWKCQERMCQIEESHMALYTERTCDERDEMENSNQAEISNQTANWNAQNEIKLNNRIELNIRCVN